MEKQLVHLRNKNLMFAYLGKLVLWSLFAFLLFALSLGALKLVGKFDLSDQSSSAFRIIIDLQLVVLFFVPLLLYQNGRRTIALAFRQARKKFASISLLRLLLFFGICLGGSAILGVISDYLIELLPKSWGIETEDATAKIVEDLLRKHSPFYFAEIFSICLLPAFVEELFFRATLQRYLIVGLSRPLLAIFVTAFIFSLAHLSLVGFLPRLWIGLVFGYLYYDSRNIFLSMALHFLNNLVALFLLISSIN